MSNALIQALADGEAALNAGDSRGAEEQFAIALALAPNDVSLALALSNAHRLSSNTDAQRAVLLGSYHNGDWQTPRVAHALGTALLEVGAAVESEACFARVHSALPNDPAATAALAAAKRACGDASAAWPLIRQAVEMAPRQPAYLLTAAQIRHDLGDLMGALKWLDKADRMRPNHGPTRVQRSYTSLLRALGANGWADFESRPLPSPATAATPWLGEPLDGRSLLITAEQGIGDQLQFLRFVRRLPALGAGSVIVECHPHLIALLRGNGFTVVPRGEAPETDVHAPLLSLPHRLGLGAQVDGAEVPYLHSIDAEAPPLPASDGRPRVGLVWAGNPSFTGRLLRDLDLTLLPDILSIDRVQWISLQQGEAGMVEMPGLVKLPPLASWAATATLLSQLDGVVTTDTGIAHLAGAMGVRTWLLLQKVPDWRWGLTGSSSAWYPSIELIRQIRPGGWSGVVARLHANMLP